MNSTMKLAGLGVAACAACCAAPLLTLTAGSGVAAGAAITAWGPGALMVALPLGTLLLLSRRKAVAGGSTFAVSASDCGCGSCANDAKEEMPIACTLDAGDFKARTAQIEALAAQHLQRVSRQPLSIELTYATEALAELRDLVRKETECCAFLDFDLAETSEGIRLRITAPEAAREAADTLFANFAPPSISKHLEIA
ncbi:hypothetical protein EHI42_23460 [Rhizobium hidalgonense]|uniref:hypothetical protein n=1 Tax=Rhizobium hidalgonense TaxID=1538159 RepID=UPI000FEC2FD4|nr:hypothetical protein [Rhizobium hidalgonense]RWX11872.1 hypothetical protein EHI42_23460 [Rhizobium hidalgonense]